MSNRSLIIALLLAVVLGVVTLLVMRGGWGVAAPPRVVPVGERLAELDAARVRSFTVTTPAETAELTRDDQGQWRLALSTPIAGTLTRWSSTWPVDPARMVSAIRLINDTRAAAVPDPAASVGDQPARVRVELDNGHSLTFALAARRLGGQGLVEVTASSATGSGGPAKPETRLAVVAESFHVFFTEPGPRGWRDPTLLPQVTGAQTPSRVRLIGEKGAVALGRVAGRWSVQEPIAAPADPEAIRVLLTTLEGLRAVRFVDDPPGQPPTAAGLDNPIARIIMERDEPAADGAPTGTLRREVRIGAPADAAGSELFATADGGETTVVVAAAPLAKLKTDADAWLARSATSVSPADVMGLTYAPAAPLIPAPTEADPAAAPASLSPAAAPPTKFVREVTGWSEIRPDATRVQQAPDRAAAITALLNFLNATPARGVALEPPAGFAPAGTLTLAGAAGEPLDELVIARSNHPGIVIGTGRVFRVYEQPPELLRILLGVQDAISSPKQPDIMK